MAFWLLMFCAATLCVVLALMVTRYRESRGLKGPLALPLIGSLYRLGGPGGPYEAFTKMANKYGDIYELQLGVSKCVVVSSYSLVKEVLITKGGHFGGRPDFMRFHQLFGGDRNNSLALCDWSDLQRKRRSIARSFCSPRGGSSQQEELSRVAVNEMSQMLNLLDDKSNEPILRGEQPIKPVILAAVGNMFTQYMCSLRFGYSNQQFNQIVRIFDEIFWEINQGYAVDFLPWLKIFYTGHMERLNNWATIIREFILQEIIEPRRASLDVEHKISRDFTDALLIHLESPESELSWQHILFELEDFLGGHSAVGNLVMMILANVVSHSQVQRKIQEECDTVLQKKLRDEDQEIISLNDRLDMPYTEAAIWETLRVSSSPIVPHVATIDTDIGGYSVAKDTVIFVNNYNLNLGEDYWGKDSKEFRPERFLKEIKQEETIVTRVVRPEYFVPFSTGKRTCIGQRLVQGCAFVIMASLLSKFDISAPSKVDIKSHLKPSCVAVPPDCFNLVFTPRSASYSANDQLL